VKTCEESLSQDAIFVSSIITHESKTETMNIGITWSQFILVLIVALAIYYCLLLLSFVKAKFKKYETSQGIPGVKRRVWQVEETDQSPAIAEGSEAIVEAELADNEEEWETSPEDLEEEKVFESLETLASEIEEIFFDHELLADKNKLTSRLEQRIRAHPLLTGAAFKNAIVNLITRKAVENNISIVRAEALALWPE